jgi:hypothetical protein
VARTLKAKALSAELGKDAAQITRWAKRGLPCDVVAGIKLFDVDEARRWIAENVRETGPRVAREPSASVPVVAQPAPAPRPEMSAHESALVAILSDPDATDLEKTHAAYGLVCAQLATTKAEGPASSQMYIALLKASEELRCAEAAHVELEERKGRLIGRDVAQAVAGGLAGRLVECLNNVENALATQVEVWFGQASFREQATEARAREVRAWFQALARRVRQIEADAVDAMITEQASERAEARE